MKPTTTRTWRVEPLATSRPAGGLVERWHLDHPVHGNAANNDVMVKVFGWALAREGVTQGDLHIVFRSSQGTWSHPLTLSRPDVVKTVLGQQSGQPPDLKCGFLHHLPEELFIEGVTMGFETEGIIHPAVKISIAA